MIPPLPDATRTAARIAGRKAADELLSLADYPPGITDAYRVAFWERMYSEAQKALETLGTAKLPERTPTSPMDDEEARRFADSPMPFGKYADTPVWQVLEDDPQYLDWLCRVTEEDDWKQNLRRYLGRRDIQEELP